MKAFSFLLIASFALFDEVYSIHCFTCNSINNPRCGSPFRPFPQAVVDCDQEMFEKNVTIKGTLCRKIVQKSNESEFMSMND